MYPDNEQFQALTNQKVSATFTVAGEKGARSVEEDPDPSQLVSVTLSVVGLDKDGKPQHWAPTQTIEVRKGTTADKVTYDYLKNNGLTYDAAGGYLSSITSPSQGLTLATAQVDGAYKWWQFFVNSAIICRTFYISCMLRYLVLYYNLLVFSCCIFVSYFVK